MPFRVLFRSDLLRIHDFVCRRQDPGPTEVFRAEYNSMVFPRRGIFLKEAEGAKVVADVNHAVFFNVDETFRFSHPCGCGDEVLELALHDSVLRDIARSLDARSADGDDRVFAVGAAPTDSTSWMLLRLLREALNRAPAPDPLEVEELCLRIAARVLRGGLRGGAPRRRRGRSATERAHAELVRRTQLTLAAGFDEPWTIDGLARSVASSPFHLSRIFRQRTGLTLHRALTLIRLRAALDRLLADRPGLTELALAAGFSSHSHFTSVFRREYGRTPSALRSRCDVAQLLKTSKALTV